MRKILPEVSPEARGVKHFSGRREDRSFFSGAHSALAMFAHLGRRCGQLGGLTGWLTSSGARDVALHIGDMGALLDPLQSLNL